MARLNHDELKVKAYLANEFPDVFTHNGRLVIGNCSAPYRRYIDFHVMIDGVLLAVEVDENQHRGYSQDDEELRIQQILHNIGVDKTMVFIRFNPSPYKVGGVRKRTGLGTRLQHLKETVESVIGRIRDGVGYTDPHTEIKLFFDE